MAKPDYQTLLMALIRECKVQKQQYLAIQNYESSCVARERHKWITFRVMRLAKRVNREMGREMGRYD